LRDFLEWQIIHQTSCTECRELYEEEKRDPPCEEKGVCPISAIELLPDNQFTLDFWHKIKGLGAELVFRMLDQTLTTTEAENLLEKLSFINHVVEQTQRHIQQEEEKKRSS
jgi:hypothetical protein